MGIREKAAILPKVHNPGNLAGKWFVYFSQPNPAKGGKLDRKKDYGEFTNYNTIEERKTYGDTLAEEIRLKILAGWNVWTAGGEKVLYVEKTAYVKEGGNNEKEADYTISFFLNKYLNSRVNGTTPISRKRKKKRTKGKLRKKSDSTYTSKVRIFLQWLEEVGLFNTPISNFKREQAERFSAYLLNERDDGAGVSGRTHNNYIETLQGLFQDIVDFEIGLIKDNPFAEVEFAKDDTEGQHPFKDHQAAILSEHIEEHNPELWLACQFLFYCFIRPGNELQNLKIEDIDLDNACIKIRGDHAKNGETEIVDIPDAFYKILVRKALHKYPDHYYVFAKAENEESYKWGEISCKPGEIPLSRDYLSKLHTAIQKRLHVAPKSSFYSWKHYGNIKAYKAGIGLIELMKQNRHKDIATTMEYFRNMGVLGNEDVKKNFPAINAANGNTKATVKEAA